MSIRDFHKTSGKELIAMKDRIRELVNHWGEDGRHKESILIALIKRFIPGKYSIATGFIVRQIGVAGEHESSTQIDIMIYDNAYPTLFKEGDFAIVTADSIKAIIEVKANLYNQKPKKIIEKANKNGKLIYEEKKRVYEINGGNVVSQFEDFEMKNKYFNGVFSYEGFDGKDDGYFETYIREESAAFQTDPGFNLFCVNHIAFNNNKMFKFWQDFYYRFGGADNCYLYNLTELSFAFFISSLIDYLTPSVISNSRIWLPFDSMEDSVSHKFHF